MMHLTSRFGLCVAGLGVLGACASAGLDYEARLPAGSLDAAEYRNVEVSGFRGPAGGWYSDRFEAMLVSAVLDGRPWFTVSRAALSETALAGLYEGRISVDDVDVHEYEQTVRKCVEWDGLFDCERREDVVEYCFDTRVDVSVYPELIDRKTGEIVFSGRYSGTASDSECHDYYDHFHGGIGRFDAPRDLIREALLDTLPDVRRDVAPRNATVRAPMVAEAIDPEARADPRFEQAVEAAKDGNGPTACSLWQGLGAEFPDAPAVTHNLGACAEASGDYAAAQDLYARAADLTAGYVQDDMEKPVKAILGSLERISERRFGEAWLEQVDDPAFPESPYGLNDDAVSLDEAGDAGS